jgi:precorrin-6Y C5,15-methyltransferase (decarboxylating) CbiT subunit
MYYNATMARPIEPTPQAWPYLTPGIPDDLFDRLPGIPMTQREIRLLMVSALRLQAKSVVWDIGAGTGTIPVEIGLLCPAGEIVAIERDEEVADLIRRNCDRFGIKNAQIATGSAPECLPTIGSLTKSGVTHACIEGGRAVKDILTAVWRYLPPTGRTVVTANSLDTLYNTLATLTELCAVHVDVVQAGINRLALRGADRRFVASDPVFIVSAEKLD